MTVTVPLTILHVKTVEAGSRTVATLASGYSGWEVAGTLGGVVGTLIAGVALILSVIAGNAKRRRLYSDDIRNAKQEVRDELLPEIARAHLRADEYEARYLNLLEGRAGQHVPQVSPRPIRRPHPIGGHDDGVGDEETGDASG